jgi:hypothetical protein
VVAADWRKCRCSSRAGAIYFGLADMLRLMKKTDGRHEQVALIYNILVFSGLVAFMVSQ